MLLNAIADNVTAVGMYETLGFRLNLNDRPDVIGVVFRLTDGTSPER